MSRRVRLLESEPEGLVGQLVETGLTPIDVAAAFEKAHIAEAGRRHAKVDMDRLNEIVRLIQLVIGEDADAAEKAAEELAGQVTEADIPEKARKAAAGAGQAMPDGSFPIRNKDDLANAIQSFGRAKDPQAVKAFIIKRARALGATDMLPKDWQVKEAVDPESESVVLAEAAASGDTHTFEVLVIQPGTSKNRRRYSRNVLESSAAKLEGARSFASDGPDHDPRKRGVKALVGWWSDPVYRTDVQLPNGKVAEGLTGLYHVTDDDLARTLRRSLEGGKPDLITFSIVANGETRTIQEGGVRVDDVVRIDNYESVDPVIHAAAGGQAVRLVASTESPMEWDKLTLKEALAKLAKGEITADALRENRADLAEAIEKLDPEAQPAAPAAPAQPAQVRESADPTRIEEALDRLAKAETRSALAEALVRRPKLPEVVVSRIREAVDGQVMDAASIEKVIDREVDYWKKLNPTAIRESGNLGVTEMKNEQERTVEHLYGMLKGTTRDSIRRFYVDLTGDVEMSGKLQESGRLTESITSTTFANVFQDAMHKRLLDIYNMPGQQLWRNVANTVPASDFRDKHLMRIGGYGNLPVVAQGQPYTALTTPGDEEVAKYHPTKRGGTEDLTFETIINDDLGAIRQIPVRLGRSAAMTLNEFVLDMIATNPTMNDGFSLFDATNHNGNTGTSALASASLKAARLAMKKQTEPGSGKKIGILPKFLLIPDDLETTAYEIVTYPKAEPSVDFARTMDLQVLTVGYWTDSNNWYLVADPGLWETIEVAFLNGDEAPQLLIQDQPLLGNVFTNDKITYRIRHIYGGSLVDWRAFYGAIVP